MYSETYEILHSYAQTVRAISTHSHHNYHSEFVNFSLGKLINTSYPGWGVNGVDCTDEGWKRYFNLTMCRSDAYWLHKAVGDIYLYGEMLSYDNYKAADARIRERYAADPYYHEKIITDICRLDTLILDEHRDPGDDHGVSFVRSAMRLDWLLAADSRADSLLNGLPDTLDEYLAKADSFIEERIKRFKVVAFKIASAYERSLDFAHLSLEEAETAYIDGNRRSLGDYMMSHVCALAMKYDLPIQIHTGTGLLDKTSAMNLIDLVRRYPMVKFVLLHCSFPWFEDALAMARILPNVYADLSWTYTLSTSMAKRFLSEALDFLSVDRIAWGCDTWTAEEGYGALMAVRQGLARELAERTDAGLMNIQSAKKAMDMVLRENALALYKL